MIRNDQILSPEDMYDFCVKNIPGIKYIYVRSEEVVNHEGELRARFDSCLPIPKTRSYHKYVPLSDRKVRCFRTSISTDFQEVNVTKESLLSLQTGGKVACIYEENWYIGIVEEVSIKHDDVKVHFYEPPGPRTSFKISRDDKTWVPCTNILRKLTPIELTTATGRCRTITPQLCDEISQLFVAHSV